MPYAPKGLIQRWWHTPAAGDNNQAPITVNGVTIPGTSPFYWQINNAMQQKTMAETDKGRFTTPQAMDLAIAMMDEEIKYYVSFAQYITEPMDYRAELAWTGHTVPL